MTLTLYEIAKVESRAREVLDSKWAGHMKTSVLIERLADVPALCETVRRAIELLRGVCNYGVHTRLKSCGESCQICCAKDFLAQVTKEPPK